MRRAIPIAAFFGAAMFLGAGCSRDEVAHYRVPRESPSVVPAALGESGMPPQAGSPRPAAPSGSGSVGWTLPAGWTEEAGGSAMRFATLHAPVKGKLDVSVTVLPGEAGGELANVNRWRNQIGLPPLDAGRLGDARKPVTTPLGPVSLYDFTSGEADKRRLVAGLALVNGYSWFVKMTGDAAAVERARPDFLKIVESLRREAAQ